MPAKKPADQLQRRNKAKSLDAQVIAINTASVPDPPAKLSKAMKAEWQRLWTSDIAGHWNQDSDVMGLRRLFSLYDRLAKYERVGDKTPLSEGSTGQQVLHPMLKAADALRTQILALEKEFGLTSGARFKNQISLGEASRSLDDLNRAVMDDDGDEADDDDFDPRVIEGRLA